MANLSKIKRERMLEFLEIIKTKYHDDDTICAFNEIENLIRDKRYGLVWEEHTEHVDEILEYNIPVFCEQTAYKIKSNAALPFNFILEGDNLQSLYLLEKTCRGMIDIIYIDPPYNTGNEDFIYNDKYVSSEDLYLHSKWLSFMNRRLTIAHKLLDRNGLCFISIDDHEVANLRLLCDEIFGHESFVGMICVETSNGIFGLKAAHADKTIVKSKDYILVYSMNPDDLKLQPLYSKSKRSFDTHFTFYKDGDYECSLNDWLCSVDFLNKRAESVGLKNNVSNLNKLMQLFDDVNKFILDNADKIYRIRDYTLNIDDIYSDKLSSGSKVLIDGNYVFIGENGNPYYLYPFSRLINTTDDYQPERCSSVIVGDLWKGFNDDMGNVGREGGVKFDNGKKPIRLIKNILKLSAKPDATVLDFFAGSGTTAEAVLTLNKEDGGHRRFIICTDNFVKEKEKIEYFVDKGYISKPPKKNTVKYSEWECEYNNFIKSAEYLNLIQDDEYQKLGICRSITYQRLKNVITGLCGDGSTYTSKIEANLKYFKCQWTPRKPEDYFLSDVLCLHVKEMIELQNAIEIDNVKNVLVLNKDDFRRTLLNPNIYDRIEKIWINQNMILDFKELELLNKKDYRYIPSEFFSQELAEGAE